MTSGPTPSQTVGPFFHIGVDDGFIGPELVPRDHPDAVLLFGTVTDGKGVPVNDSMIEIWQANPAGRYAHPEDAREELPLTEGFDGFGRTVTNEDGRYELITLKPGPVPGRNGQLASIMIASRVPALARFCRRWPSRTVPAGSILLSQPAEIAGADPIQHAGHR